MVEGDISMANLRGTAIQPKKNYECINMSFLAFRTFTPFCAAKVF
jgi:hypothetical protein